MSPLTRVRVERRFLHAFLSSEANSSISVVSLYPFMIPNGLAVNDNGIVTGVALSGMIVPFDPSESDLLGGEVEATLDLASG